MALVLRGIFFTRGTLSDPALAAVVADVGLGPHVDALLVHIVNVDVDVQHRTIVEKVIVVPASALKSMAEIAEAIVDPAIKSHVRAPVAGVEKVNAVAPAPVSGRPQKADFRSFDPVPVGSYPAGASAFGSAALIVLSGTFCYAGAVMIAKALLRTDQVTALVFYMSLLQLPMGLVGSLFVWVWPAWCDAPWKGLLMPLSG